VRGRTSTLPAWQRLAKGQLVKSGEHDLYPELWQTLSLEAPSGEGVPSSISPLDYEIRETKEQINLLKKKKKSGEIEDEVYKELLKHL
jgi:hypothetical protein